MTQKIDFESQIYALFNNPCEHLWKSNQEIIFILLIFLLKSSPCWLTSAKLYHWGHTNVRSSLAYSQKYLLWSLRMNEILFSYTEVSKKSFCRVPLANIMGLLFWEPSILLWPLAGFCANFIVIEDPSCLVWYKCSIRWINWNEIHKLKPNIILLYLEFFITNYMLFWLSFLNNSTKILLLFIKTQHFIFCFFIILVFRLSNGWNKEHTTFNLVYSFDFFINATAIHT